MWMVPLTDSTEARYGEIARKMVETNDWITPWFNYGVPFWGKPPLSTWLSALSIKVFGVNEFAVRFSSLILSIAVLMLVWRFCKPLLVDAQRWLMVTILSSMALFFVAAGMVETDMSLLFSCTLVLTSFWLAMTEGSLFWKYMAFVGLGLCMLAKGPAAVVLATLPIFFWLFWSKSWKQMWRTFPWVSGLLLTCVIFVPWYAMAEHKTPGFLDYFIVGEHIKRFLVPGWHGDRYGHAHQEPVGMIWGFLLVDALPWILIGLGVFLNNKIKAKKGGIPLNDQQKYLWCWLLTPLVFFTMAHNIILTYTLTGLPALAIILSQYLSPQAFANNKVRPWVWFAGWFSPFFMLAIVVGSQLYPDMGKKSARAITEVFQSLPESKNHNLHYVGNRLYSMDFYNRGQEIRNDSLDQFLQESNMDQCSESFLALTDNQAERATKQQKAQLKLVGSTRRYLLFRHICPSK